jgi:voltage-gated potassium channel
VSPPTVSPEDRRTALPRGRIEDRFRGRAQRAIAKRRVFRYLALMTVVTSVGAGILVRLVDPEDFATLGDAVWWAIVTLATVGYGDIVPHSAWGRVVGSVVIVVGVTFLSVLTATVTSYFVAADEAERGAETEALRRAELEVTGELLHEVLDRLAANEQELRDRDPR